MTPLWGEELGIVSGPKRVLHALLRKLAANISKHRDEFWDEDACAQGTANQRDSARFRVYDAEGSEMPVQFVGLGI